MDAGKLTERVKIMALSSAGGVYAWTETAEVWAQAELSDRPSLFSQAGVGVNGVTFTLRQRELTLNNAMMWGGRHCFLTYLEETDQRYLTVSAALITPKLCTVRRASYGRDSVNRPMISRYETITFPACLTEKYVKYLQEQPNGTQETALVLVTPKEITLNPGELVNVAGKDYVSGASHEQNEYKNEYEITRKRDA